MNAGPLSRPVVRHLVLHLVRRPDAKAAFTLVELLVVIGIIALLVGILLPVLGKARGASRQLACLSAMRQYGLANQMYLNEYKDLYLPIKIGWSPSGPGWPVSTPPAVPPSMPSQAWTTNPALRDYLGLSPSNVPYRVPRGLICPDALLADKDVTRDGYRIEKSFGYNSDGLSWADPADAPDYMTAFRRGRVKDPADKLMFADATDWVIGKSASGYYVQYGEQYGPPPLCNMTAYRHNRGANVLFFDGHGAWLRRDEVIYDPATKRNLTLWAVMQ